MAYVKQNYQPGDVLTAEQVNKIQDTIITNEGNIEGHIENKENPHGVTPAQIGAAPASGFEGYYNCVTADDLNTILNNLVTAQESGTEKTYYMYLYWYANAPLPTGRWSVTVHKPNVSDPEAWAGVTATVVASKTLYKMRRELYADTWLDWEWENPPMVLGVEYRTTERWQNKAVYTKLVDCGALPNTTTKEVSIGTACSVIRCVGMTASGTSLPLLRNSNPIYIYGNNGLVNIETSNDQSGTTATAQIWYTKD